MVSGPEVGAGNVQVLDQFLTLNSGSLFFFCFFCFLFFCFFCLFCLFVLCFRCFFASSSQTLFYIINQTIIGFTITMINNYLEQFVPVLRASFPKMDLALRNWSTNLDMFIFFFFFDFFVIFLFFFYPFF